MHVLDSWTAVFRLDGGGWISEREKPFIGAEQAGTGSERGDAAESTEGQPQACGQQMGESEGSRPWSVLDRWQSVL